MPTRLSLLTALCATALAALAKPITIRDSPVSLPLVRRLNLTGIPSILQHDQARVRALKKGARVSPSAAGKALLEVPVTNNVVNYVAQVGVGSPPTSFTLIVDTGSSNTWVGADRSHPFIKTNSSVDTGEEVFVEYGSGLFEGEQFVDKLTIGGLVIEHQGIGAAELAFGFDGVDGILGIGPVDLTEGTTSGGGSVPTVLNNAFSQGLIDSEVIGISFEPTTTLESTNGDLTFGGVNPDKFTGEIAYVPITSTAPASEFVGIDQSITYGAARTPILPTTAGITDTGTTLLLLASDALEVYQGITGAVPDRNTGLLKLTPEQFKNLESLFFHIGDNTFEFTPNAQIFPRALNTAIGGSPDAVYLIVADIGSPSGEGLDFVDGFTFLERFYNVFDAGNGQVGFATTEFTDATTN